jgi:hypothetical protein
MSRQLGYIDACAGKIRFCRTLQAGHGVRLITLKGISMRTQKTARYLSTLCLISVCQFSQALPQFINEFHYDNVGSDTEEFVEIAGVAGSDLNGWRLDFYNGTNGQIYSSWALSGQIDDEGQGWGALSFSGGGLQNGSKDGIALVDSVGSLIQFISYEGVLTGSEGAANGVTSIDVGIEETTSTPSGTSLQLSGSGTGLTDFSWLSDVSSFGQLNAGQLFAGAGQAPAVQAVSEPHSLGLLLLGLFGVLGKRLTRRSNLR